jgi:hypothetical protein
VKTACSKEENTPRTNNDNNIIASKQTSKASKGEEKDWDSQAAEKNHQQHRILPGVSR